MRYNHSHREISNAMPTTGCGQRRSLCANPEIAGRKLSRRLILQRDRKGVYRPRKITWHKSARCIDKMNTRVESVKIQMDRPRKETYQNVQGPFWHTTRRSTKHLLGVFLIIILGFLKPLRKYISTSYQQNGKKRHTLMNGAAADRTFLLTSLSTYFLLV